jgi:Holliday junction resolvase
MPNRARQRGDYFERRAQDALQAEGWWVVRAAGSLGEADLVALKAGWQPRMISCKLTSHLPRKQALQLLDAAEIAGAQALLAWSVKPGWVGLQTVERHGPATHLPMVHMPPAKRTPRRPQPDGLYPLGEQLTLPME